MRRLAFAAYMGYITVLVAVGLGYTVMISDDPWRSPRDVFFWSLSMWILMVGLSIIGTCVYRKVKKLRGWNEE